MTMPCLLAALLPLVAPAAGIQGDLPSADLELAQLGWTDGFKGDSSTEAPVLLACALRPTRARVPRAPSQPGPRATRPGSRISSTSASRRCSLAVANRAVPSFPWTRSPPRPRADMYGRSRRPPRIMRLALVRTPPSAARPGIPNASDVDRRRFDEIVRATNSRKPSNRAPAAPSDCTRADARFPS
jgi:hypothetical protein